MNNVPDETPESQEADSQPAPQARRRARRAPVVAASVLAGILVLALLALWLSGEQLTALVLGGGGGVDAAKVEVDAQAYKDYFTVERKLAANGGRTLVLTLKRTKAFPLKDSDFETLAEKAPRGYPTLLPIEALARNYYVRCEYFTKKNEFLGHTFERIRGLAERETMELTLPLSGRRGLHRVVITY